jgi:hypothetical protein
MPKQRRIESLTNRDVRGIGIDQSESAEAIQIVILDTL